MPPVHSRFGHGVLWPSARRGTMAVVSQDTQKGLLERILSAEAPVVLLRGPAGCGKTSAAVALHGHFAAEGPGRCILLVPNAASVAAMGRRLLAASPGGVVVRPMVMTFADLAGRVLTDVAQPGSKLSPFRRHLLLREIVDSLLAEGKLPALGKVADTPGLTAALDRAIAELKRAAAEPAHLAKAMGKANGKGAGLLAVYRRYQQRLHEERSFDLEGLMWLARDHLARRSPSQMPAGLSGVVALAADGFTDFTPTQLEILLLLSRMLRRVLITLPHDDDGRARMWHWTARTAGNIRRAFASRLTEIRLGRGTGQPAPPLAALWDRLFDFDATTCPLPPGVSVIAASGAEAEVAAVGRRVKRLLLSGADAGSIAVLARSMETYRPTIERVFADCRIPIRPTAQPLRESPIVRFTLDVAALGGELAYRDVLRVIKSSYFRPQALGQFDSAAVAAAEHVIRYGNVSAGRAAYARAASRLAERLAGGQVSADEDQPTAAAVEAADIRKAGEMLEALFTIAQAATGQQDDRPAHRSSQRGGLGLIIDSLQLHQAACDHEDDQLVARDLRALAALEAALAELPPRATPLDQVRQALAAVTCPPQHGESAVDVMDVLDARALTYSHVFCLGLGEGHFPRRFQESSLIGERQRLSWSSRGVALDMRDDLTAREMLLFYLAVSRASETLTLSFMESDALGRPSAPSSFVLSLLAPAGGWEAAEAAGIVQTIPPGQFLPPADELAADKEVFTAAVAGLFDGTYDPDCAALGYVARTAPHHAAAVATGLLARYRRWRRGPCDAYDGRITDGDLLAALAGRFDESAVFSATELNAYGVCPWQFFGTYVLSLHPLEVPTDRLTPLDRGLFCHKVLFAALARLAEECGGEVNLAKVDRSRLLEALDQAVADESAAVEARSLAYPALWQIQRQQMRDDMRDYLTAQQDAAGKLSARCLHFELGFGLEEQAAAEPTDPASAARPVTIDTPAGPVLLRGRIDRVDRIGLGDLHGLLVVDYKTGRLPGKSDIEEGRSLQLPLYSIAAGKLLGEEALGGAFHQIGGDGRQTCLAAVKCWGREYRQDKDFQPRLAATIEKVAQFVQSIRAGRFDLLPSHNCPPYCPFRQTCQYVEHRAALKVAAQPEDRA